MRVPLRWLNEFVDIADLPQQKVADTLASLGLPVDGIETVKAFDDGLVVGYVVDAVKHPNADTLRLCQVDIKGDRSQNLGIVCGAPNVRTGLKVVVATVGTTMPDGFKIKAAKIRGEASQGMICSGKELGISDDHDGIVELPENSIVGQKFNDISGQGETVFILDVSPNRGDCLSIQGVARDLAAKLNRPLKKHSVNFDIKSFGTPTAEFIQTENKTPNFCRRFVTLYVKNLKVTTSPKHIQKRLEAAGMRAINSLVDATNYCMLETGQPIHGYDAKKIQGHKIIIREAQDQENLVTLDNVKRTTVAGDILICDAYSPLGFAGIMGGASSEVGAETTEVLIEVAHFDPEKIRKTAKRLGLSSEASKRFERSGTDINKQQDIARYCAFLMKSFSQADAAEVSKDIFDTEPKASPLKTVNVRLSKVRQFTGIASTTTSDFADALDRLQLQYKLQDDKNTFVVNTPSFRSDLQREEDFIEEYLRIVGYDAAPLTLPRMALTKNFEPPFISFLEQVRNSFASEGFTETILFPFVSEEDFHKLNLNNSDKRIELANPLSDKERFMRTNLIMTLVKAFKDNKANGSTHTQIFEMGRAFVKQDGKNSLTHLVACDKLLSERWDEQDHLAMILDTTPGEKTWTHKEKNQFDIFSLKSKIEKALRKISLQGELSFKNETIEPFLHPQKSAKIFIEDQELGYLGELHPQVALKLDLFRFTPVVADLNLPKLFEVLKNQKTSYQSSIIKFPSSSRDLAVVMETKIAFEQIQTVVKEITAKTRIFKSFRVFDIYRDASLGENRQSVGLNFVFQAKDRTLTDQEVDAEIQKILQGLQKNLGAALR